MKNIHGNMNEEHGTVPVGQVGHQLDGGILTV